MAIGLPIGIGWGTAIGVTTGNLALWLGLGVAIGVGAGGAITAVLARQAAKQKRQASLDGSEG